MFTQADFLFHMNQGHILLTCFPFYGNTCFTKLYSQLMFSNRNMKTDNQIVMIFSSIHRTKFLLQHGEGELCKFNVFLSSLCVNTNVMRLLFSLLSKLIRESILISERDFLMFYVSTFFQ